MDTLKKKSIPKKKIKTCLIRDEKLLGMLENSFRSPPGGAPPGEREKMQEVGMSCPEKG